VKSSFGRGGGVSGGDATEDAERLEERMTMRNCINGAAGANERCVAAARCCLPACSRREREGGAVTTVTGTVGGARLDG
jgi:hypothetical protein